MQQWHLQYYKLLYFSNETNLHGLLEVAPMLIQVQCSSNKTKTKQKPEENKTKTETVAHKKGE